MWSFQQHPLIPLVFCVVSIAIVILQCFSKHRFLKVRFIFVFILTFLAALCFAFYGTVLDKASEAASAGKNFIYDDIFYWILLGIDIAVGVLLISTLEFSLNGERFQRELTSLLDETKYYVVLDKKDRVKEISKAMITDLGVDESEVIGKNFFDAVEVKYMLLGLNGEDIKKEEIKRYYKNYDKKAVSGEVNSLEVNFQDDNGVEGAYYFKETVIFDGKKYKGRILLGEKKGEEDLIGMESDLARKSGELEIIKMRFSVLLKQAEEGIYFNNLTNKSIWLNRYLVEKLKCDSNNVSSGDFYKNIHPDDVSLYQDRMKNITDDYELTYRYNTGYGFVYVREKGTKITSGKTVEMCGIMSVMDDCSYEKTGTALDKIYAEDKLREAFANLTEQNISFQIVRFKVASIPDINEKCGREIGNMMLARYVYLFRDNFVIDDLIFRVSGLEFVAILTSLNKMELLKKNLQKNADGLLHLKKNMGNKSVSIDVVMGIAAKEDSPGGKNALKNAKDALKAASNEQYSADFAYYRDIR